jgi:predicted nucleotidyltransferase
MDRIKHGLGIAEIIGDKRDQIRALAQQYGADHVRVFGSVARGEARPDSDVDLLVSFPADRSIFDLVGLWLDLTDLLGREVDLSTDESLKDYVRPHALKDAVPL